MDLAKRSPQLSKLGKHTIKSTILRWARSSTSSPSISVGGWSKNMPSRYICNHTRIHQIPPLRSLSHVKRRDLRGSETAAKGAKSTVQTKLFEVLWDWIGGIAGRHLGRHPWAMPWGALGGWKDDSINKSDIHRKRGGLLGGVLAYQETGLTGPLSIYKVVPKVLMPLYIFALPWVRPWSRHLFIHYYLFHIFPNASAMVFISLGNATARVVFPSTLMVVDAP